MSSDLKTAKIFVMPLGGKKLRWNCRKIKNIIVHDPKSII
jgi:ribosome-binding factor A